MRLMLGIKEQPSLLVDVQQEKSPSEFDFWVVNGAWSGTFYNGHVTVHHPWNPHCDLHHVEILTDNQDRLRGEYQEVFNNFDNVDYVAPRCEPVVFDDMDDDIPF
jgi:hypothetical protein